MGLEAVGGNPAKLLHIIRSYDSLRLDGRDLGTGAAEMVRSREAGRDPGLVPELRPLLDDRASRTGPGSLWNAEAVAMSESVQNYELIIWSVPVAMPRPSHRPLMRNGQVVMSKKGFPVTQTYTAKKDHPARQFKSDIRAAAQAEVMPYHEGPVKVSWTAYLPRPKALCRKKDPDGPVPHHKRPDRDNLDKTILDALKGVIYKDDSQVFSGEIKKFYHGKPGTEDRSRPHVVIRIEYF